MRYVLLVAACVLVGCATRERRLRKQTEKALERETLAEHLAKTGRESLVEPASAAARELDNGLAEWQVQHRYYFDDTTTREIIAAYASAQAQRGEEVELRSFVRRLDESAGVKSMVKRSASSLWLRRRVVAADGAGVAWPPRSTTERKIAEYADVRVCGPSGADVSLDGVPKATLDATHMVVMGVSIDESHTVRIAKYGEEPHEETFTLRRGDPPKTVEYPSR